MLEPKNTLVGLAGQKAWHVCAGEGAPSGKYLPSQLRTQKAGPELATTSRGGGGCGLLLKTLAKNEVWCRCFWPPPKKKSSKPWAELISGASATGPMMAAATSMHRAVRRKDSCVRNAGSTRRDEPPVQHEGRAANFSFAIIVDGKRALSGAEKGKEKGQWARQAPHSPPVMLGLRAVIRSALEPLLDL